MKAFVLEKPGAPGTLKLADVPEQQPQGGELRVRVRAFGLNPVDHKLAVRGHPSWSWPFILGLDVAGVVDAVGPEVTAWKAGDPVYYHGDLRKHGGYAEAAVTTAHSVSRLPAGLSFEHAAALPAAGFTAWQAVHQRLRLERGMTVLVHAAAGGVGGFAVQLAARAGARVIATCSSVNAAYVRALGAEATIDYKSEDVAARVGAFTAGRGLDAIVDTVSGQSATDGILKLLKFAGGIACIAGLPDLAAVPWGRAPSVHDLALGAAHSSGDRAAQEDLARIGDALGKLVAEGEIRSTLERTVPFDQTPAALAVLAEGHARGKTVVTLG